MANDKSPEEMHETLVADAKISNQGKIRANSLRNLNQENGTNGARNGDLGIPPATPGTISSADYSIKQRNEEFANKLNVFYAYTIGEPRELNDAEKIVIGLPISYNTPKNNVSNLRFVKFFANNTECEAWPNLENYAEDDPRRIILEGSYPEALCDVSKFGDIVAGQVVRIQYKDQVNNRSPEIIEIMGDDEGKLQDTSLIVTEDGRVKGYSDTKEIFAKGSIPKEDYFGGPKRDTKKVNTFVIHDTASTTFNPVIKTLKRKNLGVQYIVSETGQIVKSGEWDRASAHAGNYSRYSIGVEVVNPVDPEVKVSGIEYFKDSKLNYDTPWAWPSSPPRRATKGYTKGVYVPTLKQQEAVWSIVKILTSSDQLNIPLRFPGLERKKNRFVITGKNPYSKMPKRLTPDMAGGIIAHSYFGSHSDGAFTTIYCYLRSLGFSPAEARQKLIFMLSPEKLIKESVTNAEGKTYSEYYIDLSYIDKESGYSDSIAMPSMTEGNY